MKRIIALLGVILTLCLVAGSLADTSLTFNQTCRSKTASSTMIYAEVDGELVETSSLPAGSYVIPSGSGPNGLTRITYSADNRTPLYGYIDGSVITSATGTYTLSTGEVVSLPEALLNSKAALNLYLEMEYGETNSSGTYTDENGNVGEIGNESAATDGGGTNDAAWARGLGKAAAANGAFTATVYTDEQGNQTSVSVVYMGLARSCIRLNEAEVMVDTYRLSWETEAPASKLLAMVTSKTPARLRAKKSSSALVIDRIPYGTVLRVVNTGKNWTFVDCNAGPRGYIQTSSLTFFANEPRTYRTGWVATKSGHITGDSTVHVRNTTSSSSPQQEEYRVGTELTILGEEGNFCEIEVNGHHCYMRKEFVLYNEEDPVTKAEAETPES